jgi:hypothetical protein
VGLRRHSDFQSATRFGNLNVSGRRTFDKPDIAFVVGHKVICYGVSNIIRRPPPVEDGLPSPPGKSDTMPANRMLEVPFVVPDVRRGDRVLGPAVAQGPIRREPPNLTRSARWCTRNRIFPAARPASKDVTALGTFARDMLCALSSSPGSGHTDRSLPSHGCLFGSPTRR